ncbi:Putative transcriptional regulator STM3175 [hydrothermal vent metagenome]|uniref:Transcriptional regulator STM3175 n=1 Tax=hydrothermal vent metagenome TaxID=652676 RepID=A0A3B0ZX35_9ZZZZ
MNGEAGKRYANKINRVCDYISEHLNDELSVEKLSQVANFSRFHFHRQFTAYTGLTVTRYILMVRLKRAAHQLVFNQEQRIIDIALDALFENPESFSRAFKKAFDQTPSQFRQQPDWININKALQLPTIERKLAMKVEIVNFTETRIALLKHRASPALINDTVSTFIAWRKESGLSPEQSSNTYGIGYDDPKTTEPEKFHFDLCGEVNKEVPENPQGVTTSTIPGGRCARIRHHGPHEGMSDAICTLYQEWLPQSNEALRDFPCFFHYINFFPEVDEHELITDIYLPLK